MEKVLIYGDSNTWGDNFVLGKRIPDDKQWPNILQKTLGEEFKIIQEGLPGRLAGNDEKEKKYKNGRDSFISIFRSQAPVDILIISLGTNDLQIKYDKKYEDIISDLIWYKEIVERMFEDVDDRKKYFVNETMPKIIYILPINFDYIKDASIIFDINSENKRKLINQEFAKNIKDVEIIYSNDLTLFNDGIHLDYNGHNLLSLKVKEKIIMLKEIKPKLEEFKNRINLNVFGIENYSEGIPTIFIANHNCLLDIFYLAAALPVTISLISSRLIYKPDVQRQTFVNDLLYSMPIEAHGGSIYSKICLENAEKFLYQNVNLSIFPEGAYLDPSNYVYRGHTGAVRILFNSRANGILPQIIPVAIEIISNNCFNLDTYIPNYTDIINIYILEPISYDKYFFQYMDTTDVTIKNNLMHDVMDKGMNNIADKLNKSYIKKYIELFPKNNVIFSNGTKIDSGTAQNKYYINIYKAELEKRLQLLSI